MSNCRQQNCIIPRDPRRTRQLKPRIRTRRFNLTAHRPTLGRIQPNPLDVQPTLGQRTLQILKLLREEDFLRNVEFVLEFEDHGEFVRVVAEVVAGLVGAVSTPECGVSVIVDDHEAFMVAAEDAHALLGHVRAGVVSSSGSDGRQRSVMQPGSVLQVRDSSVFEGEIHGSMLEDAVGAGLHWFANRPANVGDASFVFHAGHRHDGAVVCGGHGEGTVADLDSLCGVLRGAEEGSNRFHDGVLGGTH